MGARLAGVALAITKAFCSACLARMALFFGVSYNS
jgi:hypothetical protein